MASQRCCRHRIRSAHPHQLTPLSNRSRLLTHHLSWTSRLLQQPTADLISIATLKLIDNTINVHTHIICSRNCPRSTRDNRNETRRLLLRSSCRRRNTFLYFFEPNNSSHSNQLHLRPRLNQIMRDIINPSLRPLTRIQRILIISI